MLDRLVTIPIDGGIIYTDELEFTQGAIPLLCVHGVGGHHRNFALLHAKLREAVPKAIPFFVDIPGFGNAREVALSLHKIQRFIATACTVISDTCGHQVLLFHESASVWFTLGLANHPAVYPHTVIAFNPVRILRPSPASLRKLLGEDVLDLRHEFLSRFFPPERIRRMDADELGRPSVTLTFLAELWRVQKKKPLDGWNRVVIIETRLDPMREFRIPLTDIEVERYELESLHHGIGEDTVAQQTALIVQRVIDSDLERYPRFPHHRQPPLEPRPDRGQR
jgi:hypothetical protein